jgi:hypothetical protein
MQGRTRHRSRPCRSTRQRCLQPAPRNRALDITTDHADRRRSTKSWCATTTARSAIIEVRPGTVEILGRIRFHARAPCTRARHARALPLERRRAPALRGRAAHRRTARYSTDPSSRVISACSCARPLRSAPRASMMKVWPPVQTVQTSAPGCGGRRAAARRPRDPSPRRTWRAAGGRRCRRRRSAERQRAAAGHHAALANSKP